MFLVLAGEIVDEASLASGLGVSGFKTRWPVERCGKDPKNNYIRLVNEERAVPS